MPHSTHIDLYTSIVSAKDVSPAKMPEYHPLNRQRICILSGPSRPSAETNRSRSGVGLGLTPTPNMATSRSTSGPESKFPCQSLAVLGRQPDEQLHTLIWA